MNIVHAVKFLCLSVRLYVVMTVVMCVSVTAVSDAIGYTASYYSGMYAKRRHKYMVTENSPVKSVSRAKSIKAAYGYHNQNAHGSRHKFAMRESGAQLRVEREKNQRLGGVRHIGNFGNMLEVIDFFERYYSLPHNLLRAIAIVESGVKDVRSGKVHPWPWALNVDGVPYFFENETEALHFLKIVLSSGIVNVDVGCGQISWLYHGLYFKRPEYILNPVYNMAYSAYLLSEHYSETHNWSKSVSLYHSRTPQLGSTYLKKVASVFHALKG